MLKRILPPKPCRRMALMALLSTCLFFLIYRVYSREDLQNVTGSSVNTKKLLQKEIQDSAGKLTFGKHKEGLTWTGIKIAWVCFDPLRNCQSPAKSEWRIKIFFQANLSSQPPHPSRARQIRYPSQASCRGHRQTSSCWWTTPLRGQSRSCSITCNGSSPTCHFRTYTKWRTKTTASTRRVQPTQPSTTCISATSTGKRPPRLTEPSTFMELT